MKNLSSFGIRYELGKGLMDQSPWFGSQQERTGQIDLRNSVRLLMSKTLISASVRQGNSGGFGTHLLFRLPTQPGRCC